MMMKRTSETMSKNDEEERMYVNWQNGEGRNKMIPAQSDPQQRKRIPIGLAKGVAEGQAIGLAKGVVEGLAK